MLKTSFIYLSFLIKENYRPKPLLLKINLCKPVSMGFYCWWSVPVPVITIVTICLAVIITDSICSIKSTSGAMQWLGVVIKSLFFFPKAALDCFLSLKIQWQRWLCYKCNLFFTDSDWKCDYSPCLIVLPCKMHYNAPLPSAVLDREPSCFSCETSWKQSLQCHEGHSAQ